MSPSREVIVDVREKDEFSKERIEGAIHVPLSDFERCAPGALSLLKDCSVLLMCRSGKRAELARPMAQRFLPAGTPVTVFQGGILEWKKQGKPTVGKGSSVLPLMRQVQLLIGLLILLFGFLALTVSPAFIWATLFMGAGLTVAGATGFCGMAIVLSKLPWNSQGDLVASSCAMPEMKQE